MVQSLAIEKTESASLTKQADDLLIEDLLAIKTEKQFILRWELVQMYWLMGERIRKTYKTNITEVTATVAVKIHMSERTLWYAVALYDKYPVIDQIPEGKSITMKKLITKYLTAPKNMKMLERKTITLDVEDARLMLAGLTYASLHHPSEAKREEFDTLCIELDLLIKGDGE